MPYAMGVMGTAMMDEYFQQHPADARRGDFGGQAADDGPASTIRRSPWELNRMLLDGVAAMMSPNKEQLEEERREHLHIFNLLGDPMLRLVYPDEIALEIRAKRCRASSCGFLAEARRAAGVLELVCRRDCHKHEPPIRERFDPTDKGWRNISPCMSRRSIARWARWASRVAARGVCHGDCNSRHGAWALSFAIGCYGTECLFTRCNERLYPSGRDRNRRGLTIVAVHGR